MKYDPHLIEKKWHRRWKESKTFEAIEDPLKPKYYVLDMFPYPSGPDCMSATSLGIRRPILWPATNGQRDFLSFTPWVGIALDCLLSSTRSEQGRILLSPLKSISKISKHSSSRLGLATIGIARS